MKNTNKVLFLILLSILPLGLIQAGIGSVKSSGSGVVFFDGKSIANNETLFDWNGGPISVVTGAGLTSKLNALKWVLGNNGGNGYCGAGINADPKFDIGSSYLSDSVHFKLKCESGVDTLRLQIETGTGKLGIKFKPVADNAWHQYSLAFKNMVQQDGTTAFDPATVGTIQFITEGTSITAVGKVVYITDWWTGNPIVTYPAIVFNGVSLWGTITPSGWGGSTIEVAKGAGVVANSNALKWTQGNDWGSGYSGISMSTSEPYDLAAAWQVDSVQFQLKCSSGVDTLRIQFETSPGKKGMKFKPIADGQWHSYKLPLRDLYYVDGATDFDSSAINTIVFMGEGTCKVGQIVYITNWWTGRPVFDVIPPDPPTNIMATAGTYKNVITWNDNSTENGEKYTIYYSTKPITNIANAEVLKTGIEEGTQTYTHLIFTPNTDQSITYYYAMTCTDKAGNESTFGTAAASVSNKAKGVASISLTIPKNFVADGNLDDWSGIQPITIAIGQGTGYLVSGQVIDNDADCSAKQYLAVDNQNLYVAYDVTDDYVSFNAALNTYENDSPDLFIGLYNAHGASHTAYQRGAQPDYHFRFAKDRVWIEGRDSLLIPGANYAWVEKFAGGYVVEAKVPLKTLAAALGDSVFSPVEGMRIALDASINDADQKGTREGILTYSPYNGDNSSWDVSRWLNTWIGNSMFTGVKDTKNAGNVLSYSLSDNYPNPFNPSTRINYTVKEAGMVSVKVFDILGREVATLVKGVKPAGTYSVNFDATKLASGVYLYKMESGSFVSVKKMLLIR